MGIAIAVQGSVYLDSGPRPHQSEPPATIARCKLLGITDLFLSQDLVQAYARTAREGDFCAIDPRDGGIKARVDGLYIHSINTSSWLAPGVYDYANLVRSLSLVSAALGHIPLGYSPRWRGESLLKLTNNKHPEWFLGPVPKDTQRDTAPNWVLPQRRDTRPRYLHSFDRRADYLGISRSTKLGIGEPKYTREWSPNVCGMWRVKASPHLVNSYGPIRATDTYDTATVRASLAYGQDIEILGGYVFPESYTVLRAWAERITSARLACMSANDALAVDAIKAIYTRTLGDLARKPHSPRLWSERAHWWYGIVAESSRRMYAHVAPFPEVMAMETDRIALISPHRSPVLAFPTYGANAGANPGNWRYIGSMPMRSNQYYATQQDSGGDFFKTIDDMGQWEDYGDTAVILPLDRERA